MQDIMFICCNLYFYNVFQSFNITLFFSDICMCFSDQSQYTRAAISRALAPYRSKTMSTYRHQTICGIFINVKANITLSVNNLLGFLEFLFECKLTPRAISNYCNAIKSYLNTFHMPTSWMENTLLTNYLTHSGSHRETEKMYHNVK